MAARCRQARLCHQPALVLTNSAGNAVFDTHGNTLTLAGSLSGPGGLVKTGSGTLLLTAANRYSGPTAITLGTLEAGSTGSLPGLFGSPSRVSVAKGAKSALERRRHGAVDVRRYRQLAFHARRIRARRESSRWIRAAGTSPTDRISRRPLWNSPKSARTR